MQNAFNMLLSLSIKIVKTFVSGMLKLFLHYLPNTLSCVGEW